MKKMIIALLLTFSLILTGCSSSNDSATNSDSKTVYACQSMANEIIGELIEFHLTSYLRTKFDQAKQSTQKLEIVVYEMSLRGK